MEIKNLLQSLSGGSAVQYALWAALLMLALIAGMAFMSSGPA